MFDLKESTGIARKLLVASFPSFGEAEAYLLAMNPVCVEIDADYQGCADAYLSDGRLMVIEPRGFAIA